MVALGAASAGGDTVSKLTNSRLRNRDDLRGREWIETPVYSKMRKLTPFLFFI